MKIETATIKSNILFTAILLHSIIVVFAPAAAVMAMIFMQGRHRRRVHTENDVLSSADSFISTVAVISVILVVVLTGMLYFRNFQRKFIVSFEFDDEKQVFQLGYKTYYNNKLRFTAIPYNDIECSALVKPKKWMEVPAFQEGLNPNDLILDEKISFTVNGKYVGEISKGGTYWNKEGGKIKLLLKEMEIRKSGLQKT